MPQAKKTDLPPSPLFRSETNKVIAGICGGLGVYFNIDPTIIRIIFILITIFGGSGLLIYIILWLLIPTQSQVSQTSEDHIKQNANEMKATAEKFANDIRGSVRRDPNSSKAWWGFLIIILGIIFLLNNFGYYDFYQFHQFWPVILIVFGISILLRKR